MPAAGAINDIVPAKKKSPRRIVHRSNEIVVYVVIMGTAVRGRFGNRGGIEFESGLHPHVPPQKRRSMHMGLSRFHIQSIGW